MNKLEVTIKTEYGIPVIYIPGMFAIFAYEGESVQSLAKRASNWVRSYIGMELIVHVN